MRDLSSLQQKIFLYLRRERTPRMVKQIARGCLTSESTLSKQLGLLEKKFHVPKTQEGRASYYELNEALFRFCNEAEHIDEAMPLPLFLDFLQAFYTNRELLHQYEGFRLLSTGEGEREQVLRRRP